MWYSFLYVTDRQGTNTSSLYSYVRTQDIYNNHHRLFLQPNNGQTHSLQTRKCGIIFVFILIFIYTDRTITLGMATTTNKQENMSRRKPRCVKFIWAGFLVVFRVDRFNTYRVNTVYTCFSRWKIESLKYRDVVNKLLRSFGVWKGLQVDRSSDLSNSYNTLHTYPAVVHTVNVPSLF